MTPEAIEYMVQREKLFLDKERKKSYFEAANFLKLTALLPIAISVYFFATNKKHDWLLAIELAAGGAAFLFIIGHLIYLWQQHELKLTTFQTQLSKAENATLALKTLETLQWPVDENSPDFIEARNPKSDFRTWNGQMISIVLLDGKMLLHSACQMNGRTQVGSWGKNGQNTRKFIKTFKSLIF